MNDFGFNSNGFVRQFLDKPIATYTHSTNKEVVVSAVNVDTDVLTSNGHGYSDSNKVYFVPNSNCGLIYPVDKFPGGVSANTAYYVKVVDENTFKLYTENALTNLVNLSANANLDMTKWHLETVTQTVTISNLPTLSKCKLIITGKHVGSSVNIYPTGVTVSQDWLKTGETTYSYGILTGPADIFERLKVDIDYAKMLTISVRGIAIKSNTTSANVVSLVNVVCSSPTHIANTFTSLAFTDWFVANGWQVEVYRA